ncbi:MAG: S8 family serine peptidase [candidate division Zixibacteria bacterium]|nr:S8 family serine peptidase [candidate division Zixibacteria bacterium]MDD4917347.1 S8 family serine peptidase [candidate division Zixibacteria bacterium]MDM7971905.1 S8 family serine peptidase [candidate division Zixibacteria bacterium]
MRAVFVLVMLTVLCGFVFAEDFRVGQSCVPPSGDEYVPDEIVVKFKDGVGRQAVSAALADLGATTISTNRQIGFHQLRIPAGTTVEEMVAAFGARPDVEYAEPNYIAHAFMTPNDPYYTYQWHMPLIKMPAAWDQTTGSPSVIVAVVDCGVAYETYGSFTQAPDLAGTSFVPGYDFINNDSHPNDDCAHGTHVAGTVAQTTNNNLGVTGVAFNCSIMPVKVLDASGSGSYTAIANGVTFAADNGAHVINMSLGGSYNSSTLQNAVVYAYNKGVTIVCAAGNAGTSTPQYPAAYSQCISVSAVRYNKTYTSYTSYGSTIDICAPGGDVSVDQNGDGYVDGVLQQTHDGTNYGTFGYYFYEGTSMASPHVAGVAALLIAKNGGSMAPADVRAALQNTAEDLGAAGWDQYYGYGLVDANAALLSISTNNPPVAAFSGTPTSGTAPLTVVFTDASTNNPTSWSWNFGDGGTSTAQNPTHTYASAGTYTVTLTATNAYGSDSETKTGYITVSAPPTYPPVAAFSGTPTSGTAPLTVVFTDASTNTPTSWSWNFGDGGTSTAQNPTHTYTSAGTYTVTLTATNAYGSDSETKTNYITVTTETAQCDDFNDGNYTGWSNKLGTWSAANYYLKGNSTTSNARLTSPFGTFSTATITCKVRMNTGRTQRNTRIIFAYTNSSNYRYVQFDDYYNRVYVGEILSGRQYTRAYASYTFSTGVWYDVTVSVAASGTVSMMVGSTSIGSYTFSARAGLVGVGYTKSNSDFDDFCVNAAASWAEAPAAPAELVPAGFELAQNYPNPFNPTTTISFTLPTPGDVTLEVFNVLGQRVAVLASGPYGAGTHHVEWNASGVSSGVYLYRLSAGEFTETRKMLLVK